MQGCSDTAKHVAGLLGNIEERHLGGKENKDASRTGYIQALEAIPEKNAVLLETFPHGVAFHHAGLLLATPH